MWKSIDVSVNIYAWLWVAPTADNKRLKTSLLNERCFMLMLLECGICVLRQNSWLLLVGS
jgi:hypothetical protein